MDPQQPYGSDTSAPQGQPDNAPQGQTPFSYPPPAQLPNRPPTPVPPTQPGYPPYNNPGYYPVPINGGNILAIGIISFFCIGVILGPVAWILGNNALAAIRAGQADPMQMGNVTAGRICGIVSTCIHGAVILIYGLIFGLSLIAALSSGSSK